jgi:hypothetical protein
MSKMSKSVLVVFAVFAGLGALAAGCTAPGPSEAPATGEPPTGAAGPAPTIPISGSRTAWGGYSVIAPPGMTPAIGPDGLQIKRSGAQGGDCTIVLLPQEPASGLPDAQAFTIATRYFQGTASGFLGPHTGPDPYSGQERGVSARGFEWVELPELWPLGPNGQMLNAKVRIMLVLLGAKVAPIVGIETGDARCLSMGGECWLQLFYSLDFPDAGLKATSQNAAQVAGTWSIASASGAVMMEYLPDGGYRSAVGSRTSVEISDTRERETDRTWANGGRWSVQGDLLTQQPEGRPLKTTWFRIVRERNTSVPSGWITQLRTFDLGQDGKPYEGSLMRNE